MSPKEQRGPCFSHVQFFNNLSSSILQTCTYLPYFATTPCSTLTIMVSLHFAPTMRVAGNISEAYCHFFQENASESNDRIGRMHQRQTKEELPQLTCDSGWLLCSDVDLGLSELPYRHVSMFLVPLCYHRNLAPLTVCKLHSHMKNINKVSLPFPTFVHEVCVGRYPTSLMLAA